MEIQKRNKTKNDTCSFSVTFDGGLQSCVRAELISELLKYILYERQQIPLPFEQVKRDVEQKTQTDKETTKVVKLGRLRMKKAVEIVNKLEDIIRELKHAFHVCPEIRQAAIALGATIVSPKEVFIIQLPPLNPDADNLSGKVCIKSLFRQLIMQDPLRDVKQISPSNISLLLSAPRNSNLSWFYPKATYKLPIRGRHFEFCLHSNCGQGNHDLSTNLSAVELSGLNPFESFIEEQEKLADGNLITEENSSASDESVTADYVCIDSDHDMEIIPTSNICDASNSYSHIHTADTIDGNPSDKKRMKKFDSKSSVLSCSSVLGSVSDKSTEFEDKDTGIFSLNDAEFIWFKSPLVMKGYRSKF